LGRINVMPLFKIKIPDLIGFAAENAKPYSKVGTGNLILTF